MSRQVYRGESNRSLTDREIEVVRRLVASGISVRSVAKDFGVGKSQVAEITGQYDRDSDAIVSICRNCGEKYDPDKSIRITAKGRRRRFDPAELDRWCPSCTRRKRGAYLGEFEVDE